MAQWLISIPSPIGRSVLNIKALTVKSTKGRTKTIKSHRVLQ